MIRLADIKKRLMADPEFEREYAAADAEFAVIEAQVRARTVADLSQAELAHRIGMEPDDGTA